MWKFDTFDTWSDVITAAERGEPLYYQAPLDRTPRLVTIYKVNKNGTLRVHSASSDVKFKADAGHLTRFRRRA